MRKPLTILTLIAVLFAFQPASAFTSNTHATDLEQTSNQYWSVADNASLDITGDLTISFWMKIESFPTWGDSQSWVVDKWHGGNFNRSYAVWFDATNLCSSISDAASGGEHKCTPHSFTTGVWYHVVFVFTSSSKTHDKYVNGSLLNSTTGTVNPGNSPTNLYIGIDVDNPGITPRNQFDGMVDDVRIWSRALSSSEVSSLYSDPCNFSNGTNLVSQWLFDNNGNDSFGSNNLTNNNSATFTTSAAYACAAGGSTYDDDDDLDGWWY